MGRSNPGHRTSQPFRMPIQCIRCYGLVAVNLSPVSRRRRLQPTEIGEFLGITTTLRRFPPGPFFYFPRPVRYYYYCHIFAVRQNLPDVSCCLHL